MSKGTSEERTERGDDGARGEASGGGRERGRSEGGRSEGGMEQVKLQVRCPEEDTGQYSRVAWGMVAPLRETAIVDVMSSR